MDYLSYFQEFSSNVWLYGGSFLLVLSILVFIHEWGHYIVARMCGVRVETFSIGFGPELFGVTDRNGTHWKFSIIPLGGYVKLFGDVDPASAQHTNEVEDQDTGKKRVLTPAELQETFFNKPVWKRALVVAAGPGINYLFAIVLMAGLFVYTGQPVTPPEGAAVVVGSSADEHGFKPHDRIISIDGKSISSFEDIRREMMIALDEERHFEVERKGQLFDIHASPKKKEFEDRFGFKQSIGLLGLISPRQAVNIEGIVRIDNTNFEKGQEDKARALLLSKMDQTIEIEILVKNGENDLLIIQPRAEFNEAMRDPESKEYNVLFLAAKQGNDIVEHSVGSALLASLKQTYVITRGTLEALGQMITGTRSATELGGIIRIGAIAGDMAQQGLIALIMFTALLSINLGLINLFPIPMLDGGHLVFYAVESALGKPVPEQVQEYAFRVGLVFLVGIMLFANINDIVQLVL